MLREKLIDVATMLSIDGQLRAIRGTIRDSLPAQKRIRANERNMNQLMAFTLTADANCIDIGAYRGEILEQMLRLAPYGKHIAYEPQPDKYKDLQERFPMVDVRQAAVSNEEGEATFTYVKNLPAYSGLREIAYPRRVETEKLAVRLETLDSCLPPGYRPSLIKIDVEGAEGLVIEGGLKTITQYKPTIIFEHQQWANSYGVTPRHVYQLLHDEAGLRIFDLDGNGPYSLNQFEEAWALGEHWDYVAHK